MYISQNVNKAVYKLADIRNNIFKQTAKMLFVFAKYAKLRIQKSLVNISSIFDELQIVT